MGWSARTLLVLVALVGMVNLAAAQDVGPGCGPRPAIQTPTFFMSMPSFFPRGFRQPVSLGDLEVRPAVRVGYQKIGLNFNIPAFSQIDNRPAPIDLSVKDANVWVGAVRLDVDFWRDWFLFGSAEANAQRSITVFTYDEPTQYIGFAVSVPYEWTGTKLEWWSIDCGIGYRFCPGAALVAGSRWDHLSLLPSDPRDRAGNPVNLDLSVPGASLSERAYSDIRAKTWIPYVGVQLIGRCFRASLLWSPIGDANVRVPLRFTRLINIIGVFPFPRNTDVEYAFRLRKPAGFLEGNFDYQMTAGGTLGLGLWLKGTWLMMRGTGEMTQDFHTVDQRGIFPPLFESQEATGTYSRYIAAGGLSAWLTF
jgi:hypothetical protein